MAPCSALRALALSSSALGAALVFLPGAAQAVIVWDWSVSGDGATGSGTFTTAGDTPTVGTTYTVTGVTGSFTTPNEGFLPITGLFNQSNFQWSGAGTNELLTQIVFPNTVSLTAAGGESIEIFGIDFNNFIPTQGLQVETFDSISLYSVTSTLTPQSAPAPVPGPLPLLGGAAAFGWSRKLKKRLAAGTYKL